MRLIHSTGKPAPILKEGQFPIFAHAVVGGTWFISEIGAR
jgi:hypothetical protein